MKIIYTLTDEAPALATRSLLPIVEAFAGAAGVEVEPRDISLAGRMLAQFPERLDEDRRVPDALAELGELARTPEANIVKLPNISASVPQLKAAIQELQGQGSAIPDYPEDPADDAEREVRARYDRVKGSAVNPVLREGNSDRRAPASVKAYARAHPHPMGAWRRASRSHVATMREGDFRSTERSVTVGAPGTVRIEHVGADGTVTVLKERTDVLAGEVLDAAVMRRAALDAFLAEQVQDARERRVLFSVHLKATMMKVSDPIVFGHAVRAYFPELFAEHGDLLASVGVSPEDGLASLERAIEALGGDDRAAVEAAITAAYERGPALAMVDSDRGITNLHVPSDVIIDASMPAAIRSSGQMWNAAGEQQDAKYVIPDSSYAALYGETIDHCREHGAFDPATMGTTPNVGLMAQKAEEYGSHDKTFEIAAAGAVRVVDQDGATLLEHDGRGRGHLARLPDEGRRDPGLGPARGGAGARHRRAGRLLARRDAPPRRRAAGEGPARARRARHRGLRLEVLPVAEATRFTLDRARRGQDTISVTGNVLRDYLTDLFPILELGTSAKMLSIVPLMAGGGPVRDGRRRLGAQARPAVRAARTTCAGTRSASSWRWRWRSRSGRQERQRRARGCSAEALDRATGTLLEQGRSPSRRVGELDNRGSHFYLALFWAQELAAQAEDAGARGALRAARAAAGRGGGDDRRRADGRAGRARRPRRLLPARTRRRPTAAMRPSATLNAIAWPRSP